MIDHTLTGIYYLFTKNITRLFIQNLVKTRKYLIIIPMLFNSYSIVMYNIGAKKLLLLLNYIL